MARPSAPQPVSEINPAPVYDEPIVLSGAKMMAIGIGSGANANPYVERKSGVEGKDLG